MQGLEMIIVAILVNFFDAYIVYTFFKSFLKTKSSISKNKILIAYSLLWIISATVHIVQNNPLVFLVSSLISYFCLTLFVYSGKWYYRILMAFCLFIVSALADILVGMFTIQVTGITMEFLMKNSIVQFTGGIMTKLTVFLFVQLISYIKLTSFGKIRKTNLIALFSVPALSMIVMFAILRYMLLINLVDATLGKFALISILYINLLIFIVYENVIKQSYENSKLEIAEQQLKLQSNHYKEINESNHKILEIKHDIKNYIIGIDEMIKDNRIDMLKEYLKEWDKSISYSDYLINTENPIIDALVSHKKNTAANIGISFNTKIAIPPNINIDPIDICIILGNALDNAIEACERIPKREEAFINLNMGIYSEGLKIIVENSFDKNEIMRRGDKKTIKDDKIGHGIGLMSIENTVKKHHGIVSKSIKDSIHILDIYIVL